MSMNRNVIITGSGMYAPGRVLENSYFNELLGTDVDTWLRENLTIERRHWCEDDESTADLCEAAAKQAIENAGLTPNDIDLLIVATDTPEYISPSTASVLQHRLGAKKTGTFDMNTACAGFVTAMDVASKYIKSDDQYTNALVIGAYAMSKYLDMNDKKTVTLFADGAGAVILSAEESEQKNGYLTGELRTDGQYNSWMGIYGGGTNQPSNQEVIDNKDHKLKFVKRIPAEINPEIWPEIITDMCTRAGITPEEVSHYFLTQININGIHETMDRLGVDRSRAHTIMKEYGYTGSACVPMAFHDAMKSGKPEKGDYVIFLGSGGGLAFAGTLFKY